MKVISLLGNSARIKVIKYILTNPREPYSKADIARATNLTWGTISANLIPAIKTQLLIKTEEYGRGTYYKTNTKSITYKIFTKEVSKRRR